MDRSTYSEEEIEALITGTERGLIRFAMRYLKDHAGACDAVQDAYIRYVRFLQGPPPGVVENPGAWLFRTTRNICLDILKSARMRLNVSLEAEPDFGGGAVTPGADAASVRKDDVALARSLFESLNEREREIVILKMEHDKSYKEIAEIMNLTVSNVGFILHGALKKLRNAYREKELL